MIRAAELGRAQALAEQIACRRRLAARLDAGEELHLILGEVSQKSEIVLSQAYAGQIRDDVRRSLSNKLGELEAELRGLGVEP